MELCCHVCWWRVDDMDKNFTFSIRNYYTGALYWKHLQKGRDNLMRNSTKGAEGYAAHLTLNKAKASTLLFIGRMLTPLQMQWLEHFGDAEIIICGGHAVKAHKKHLEKLAKLKSFTDKYKKKHR